MKTLSSIAIVAVLMCTASRVFAAENPSAMIKEIISWNEYKEVLITLTTTSGPQPPSGYIWFDASSDIGKNTLSLLTAAFLAGKAVDISWQDSATPGILSTSAYKLAAVRIRAQ